MVNKPIKHKAISSVLLVGVCGLLLSFANAQAGMSQSEIDRITANWKCKWCPYKETAIKEGEVEVGFGNVSNDSFKHGKYTGLDKKGGFLVGDGSYEYKDNKSSYLNIDARDVGLDSRQLQIEGGSQGNYSLKLNYSMLPSMNIDTARTPYRGKENQKLPAGWVQAVTTGGMTQLPNSLRDIEIYTDRKTIDVGATYHSSPSLSYDLNFQQQTRQGTKAMGLALLTNSVILGIPVDTSTKQGEAKINYRGRQWRGSLGYSFSIFTNAHDRVRWDNAYSTPATATEGQAALEPENEMQQVTLDGNYRFSADTRATIAIALGRMTQNDDFLPYTVNGTLGPPPLPRSSLNGEVDTFNSALRFNTRWNKNWNYSVQYRHNEQSNDTPRATYNYVFADFVIAATPRANFPFSFRERELSLQGKYQINEQRHITLDYKRETDERTYQEVETTNEDVLSVFYRSNINEALQWSLKILTSNRVGDEYTAVSEISPPENTLLRKYNLADRKRKMATASLTYSLTHDLQISVFGDYAYDDYLDSEVGLLDSQQSTVSLELQYQLKKDLGISLDYSATDIDSSQAGTSWEADNVDSVYVAHVGINYNLMKNKLTIGADYTYVNAVGDITVSTGSGFPKLESTRKSLSLYADYQLNEQSLIHAFFGYEDYEEEDWAIEGVTPNTINSVLALGETSPSYDIGVFAISYRTKF